MPEMPAMPEGMSMPEGAVMGGPMPGGMQLPGGVVVEGGMPPGGLPAGAVQIEGMPAGAMMGAVQMEGMPPGAMMGAPMEVPAMPEVSHGEFELTYRFKKPILFRGYILETANIEGESDPKDWTVDCRNIADNVNTVVSTVEGEGEKERWVEK